MQHTILVTGALHPQAIQALHANKNYLVIDQPDCSKETLLKHISSAHVLVTRSETDVDKELIDQAPHLKILARAAVGVGNINIDYATEKGILVINTPGKNTNSAAEMTFALLLAMMRKLPEAQNHLKAGLWQRHQFQGTELRGKSIGIVGLGNVGHRVAKFAHGFDMRVYAYDPYTSPDLFTRYGVIPCSSLKELASQVTILSVHVPLNQETRAFISQDVLSALPPGSYVLNAARGEVMDEKALRELLISGHISACGIDTWCKEPKPWSELWSLPQVYATPHIGASTVEAQLAIGMSIVEQIQKALAGQVVDHPINLPYMDPGTNPLLRPYTTLAEKLGSLIAQLYGLNPQKMEIHYRGDLAGVDRGLIRVGLMKGYLSHSSGEYISYVNAEPFFKKLAIRMEESDDPDFQNYKSSIKINVTNQKGQSLTVGGLVFDQKYIRRSMIDRFHFEIEPMGRILVVQNKDRPGVIGALGSILASERINIDSFDLCRDKEGGEAMALIKVDQPVPDALLTQIELLENVISARVVSL